ncbi:MAG TPA: hypothetical protein VFQ95_07215 [Rhodanobacteraceae bacterium]|nr:hypothetical protein [Rhodanobacteraceae bacterium]
MYLIVGAGLGTYMGFARNFALAPVHAHLLLAGWLTLAMAGVIYHIFPVASGTALARWHFWLHNLGLPLFLVALGGMLLGLDARLGIISPAIAVGVIALLSGFVCFALNVWRTIKPAGRTVG